MEQQQQHPTRTTRQPAHDYPSPLTSDYVTGGLIESYNNILDEMGDRDNDRLTFLSQLRDHWHPKYIRYTTNSDLTSTHHGISQWVNASIRNLNDAYLAQEPALRLPPLPNPLP